MYSETTIAKSLKAIEDLWARQAIEAPAYPDSVILPADKPTYHSVHDAQTAVAHFDEKMQRAIYQYGEDDAWSHVSYDLEELRWIRNERAICQADYLYYASRYVKIMGEEQVIKYQPQLSQQIFNHYRALIEDLGWAIMMQVLKARQVGITTDCQSAISHRTCFFTDVIALTGSCERGKTAEMVDKYKLIYEHLPYWLKPAVTSDRQGAVLKFGAMNSRLLIQHGRMMTGIGRGNTPGIVHLSELAEFDDPATLIDAGLVPAIHENPRILFILESTAAGPHDWWYDKWQFNKANYWEGRAKMCPMFLPWFTRPDIYPTPGWLTQHRMPFDWSPDSKTIAHAERAAKAVRNNDILRKFFPENWKMPREQMWFWELTREEYRAGKKLDIFQREFCADDMEAFTASGESVFDVEVISSYNEYCQEPVGFYAFRSNDMRIPARFHPQAHDIDRSRKVIKLGPYELVPCRWQGWDATPIFERLLMFEWPREGMEYVFGVDTGFGIGKDRSVVEGLRKGTAHENDAQVCEFASPYVNAEDLAPICHAIGLLYQPASGRQPRMVIEAKANGELTQHVMKQLGWAHFHNWVRYDRKKIDPSKATRLGFFTNLWSRPMVMDKMVRALRGGLIDINSKEFVREMASLHSDEDMQDARAEHGAFDDRFMAFGIAYFSAHILEFSGKAVDVSFLRQTRMGHEPEKVLYQPNRFELISYRPDEDGSKVLLDTSWQHPGSIDTSWETE